MKLKNELYIYSQELNTYFSFHDGHTINIYYQDEENRELNEYYCLNIGDFSKDKVSLMRKLKEIDDIITQMKRGED